MNASFITELNKEQRQDAYKKYQLIEPYLNGTLKLNEIAKNKQIPIRTLNLWLKKYRQNRLIGVVTTSINLNCTDEYVVDEFTRKW